MATQFEEVKVATIDQGAFLADGENAFLKVQKKVIAHAKEHGGATGEVNLKVKISADGDGVFKLVTDVTEKMPKKPSRVTAAFVNEGEDGAECLFSQAGGTMSGHPRQMRLCDDDGVVLDQPDEATA